MSPLNLDMPRTALVLVDLMPSPINEELRKRDITTLVLAGMATNFGVESTGRGADDHGYETVFVTDAMTSLATELHNFSVERIFPTLGKVTTVDELL